MTTLDFLEKLLGIVDEAIFPLLATYLVWLLKTWLAGKGLGKP